MGGEGGRVAREEWRAGGIVFREGEAGETAYYIERGQVRIVRRAAGGEMTLARLGSGEVFGDLALIDDRPRSATAVCEKDCTLLAFPRQYLHDAMERVDPVLPLLLKVLARRSRESDDHRAGLERGAAATHQPAERPAAGDDVEPHRRAFARRLAMERDLMAALDEGHLFLVAQPIVELASGRVAGVEALMRLNHPQRGTLPPGEFMPLAEERGLILQMGRWALARAAEIAKLCDGLDFVSVNVAAQQLQGGGLSDEVSQACRRAGIQPRRLKLEVTESGIIDDPHRAAAVLREVRAVGCGIAIDDFGTGQSSFAYLHRLPLDTLKIDKSFVAEMTTNDRSRRIVSAMARMAGELGIDAVAEGVESREQRDLLRAMGCRWGQGYHFGAPAPPESLSDRDIAVRAPR